MDDVSRVVDERRFPYGVLSLPDGGFAEAFNQACGDWHATAPQVPVIACGMVGSRQGWIEAPYAPCPAGLDALANALAPLEVTPVEGNGELTIHVVPGLSIDPVGDVPDVMRGEETQVYGAVGEIDSATVILPGTHSKWVKLSEGRIESFATFMTGEMYDLLCTRSILSTIMENDVFVESAFDDGVRAGVDGFAADGVLHHLFGVRALALFGRLAPEETASYLSGLLIGAEVGGATRAGRVEPGSRLIVLGEQEIAERYIDALDLAGLDAEPGPPEASAAGMFRIASRAGLLRGD